ncbi:MAG: FeoB-associated Cys-rich membrane protein [Muricomes sp.]
MGTVVVGAILAGAVAMIIRKMIRDKKSGKGHCGGDCGHCGGHCGQ